MNAKRIIDICFSVFVLVITSPILALVAVAIKTSEPRENVIFRQNRVGLNGAIFELLKFRSMTNSHDILKTSAQVTSAKDIRITRIGHIIRKLKLDELPQFLNVIFGDMSVVGPRPEVPRYIKHIPSSKREKLLSIKPGITDPVSIIFYDESDILANQNDPEVYYIKTILPRKVNGYLRYIESQSLAGDMKIILQTATKTASKIAPI